MLPDYSQFIFFLTATVLLNLTPGSDVLYIASQSFANKKQGIFAALGITTGAGVYVIATAFGLAEVFHHFPLVYEFIKIVGAVYLFYLAWKYFTSAKPVVLIEENNQQRSFLKSYYVGILTTILNPKVGLFFITFLPQFSDNTRGKIWLQLLSLGGCFMISASIINILYALLISRVKGRLFEKSHIQLWLNKVSAAIFCILAIKVLTTQKN